MFGERGAARGHSGLRVGIARMRSCALAILKSFQLCNHFFGVEPV